MTRIIRVFGSNEAGRHGAGAARTCLRLHGAIYYQGFGLQGNSFGVPTKDGIGPRAGALLPLWKIKEYVDRLIQFMREHPELEFDIWEIGCGLAKPCLRGRTTGYGCDHPECRTARVADIATLFAKAQDLANARLPQAFVNYLNGVNKETEDNHHDY